MFDAVKESERIVNFVRDYYAKKLCARLWDRKML